MLFKISIILITRIINESCSKLKIQDKIIQAIVEDNQITIKPTIMKIITSCNNNLSHLTNFNKTAEMIH